ncbi:hypothetical protein [Streptomyces sp. NPDC059209]|uniref:hypothetical protein n=1 Tax=Streptomyces sp. NPDC059209 TaxID=3346769 RepID=UPI0036B7C19D
MFGFRLLVAALRGGDREREQPLGHRCLLVRGTVVRAPTPRGRGAQLPAHDHTGEDRTVVAQRYTAYLPLPHILAQGPGFGRRRLVQVRYEGRRAGWRSGRAHQAV